MGEGGRAGRIYLHYFWGGTTDGKIFGNSLMPQAKTICSPIIGSIILYQKEKLKKEKNELFTFVAALVRASLTAAGNATGGRPELHGPGGGRTRHHPHRSHPAVAVHPGAALRQDLSELCLLDGGRLGVQDDRPR